jgi:hypothetical protein
MDNTILRSGPVLFISFWEADRDEDRLQGDGPADYMTETQIVR